MNNFQLHNEAIQLSDTRSAYDLAREVVELKKLNKELKNFQLHNEAIQLSDTRSPYDLAREVVELKQLNKELKNNQNTDKDNNAVTPYCQGPGPE